MILRTRIRKQTREAAGKGPEEGGRAQLKLTGMHPFLALADGGVQTWQEMQEPSPLGNEDRNHAQLSICQGPACC